MKKLIVLLSFITLIISCDKTNSLPPDTYEVTGTAKGIYNGIRAYLKFSDERGVEFNSDTAIIVNEMFSFKGKISNSTMQTLTINSVNGSLLFVLEPGKINIEIYKDSISKSKITGSENNEIFNVFKVENEKKLNALREIGLQAREARNQADKTLYNELVAKTNELNQDLRFYAHDFIEENSNSDFSLLLLESITKNRNPDLESFKSNYAKLNNVINKNAPNKALGAKIENFILLLESRANLEIGKIAPNFSSFTPDGKNLSLSDIKGKATIIDFWASWCAPCRRENPNVVNVYNKYHNKGLEIISISLDGSQRQNDPKALWLKAIEDDKMTWYHVSSLKHFQEPIAKLYNISSIPATFILDEEGKIVAKGLRGDALEKQIAEMLN